jgi:hypothetical protein
MAPSDEEIEQALLDATYQVYQAFPDETTVNKVRKQTEENLSLEDGFLSSGDWKKKSKELVKERAVSFTRNGYSILETYTISRRGLEKDGFLTTRRTTALMRRKKKALE